MKPKKTIGLALGSGAFRGLALIGVLKSFEKHKIKIDYLSGASVGAWVAAYYAIFRDIYKLEKEILTNPRETFTSIFDLSWRGGFVGGEKFIAFLEKNLHHHQFSKLKIPLQIVATDLITGQPFIFKEGDIARAVRASTSVPLVFKPLKYKNKLLIDGGLSNPVPGDLVRKMGADIVVGVNLYNQNEFVDREFTMPKIVLRSTRILMHNLSKSSLQSVDIAIKPDTSVFVADESFKKYIDTGVAKKMIKIGEQAADKIMPQLKKLLK